MGKHKIGVQAQNKRRVAITRKVYNQTQPYFNGSSITSFGRHSSHTSKPLYTTHPRPRRASVFLTSRMYYKAIILDQTKKLWDMSSLQPWTLIEANGFAQTPSLLLAAIWLGYHPPCSFLPTVNATLSTWRLVLQSTRGIHVKALHQLTLSSLSFLSPDIPLENWSSQGLQKIGDLFQHNSHPSSKLQTILPSPIRSSICT